MVNHAGINLGDIDHTQLDNLVFGMHIRCEKKLRHVDMF